MAIWLQNAVVLLLVGGCVAFVAVQGYRSLIGKRSKIGSCCAKGCGEAEKTPGGSPKAERIVFLPAEMLTSSSRQSRER